MGRRPLGSHGGDRPAATDAPWDRDGLHSGVGGLALVLAEIRAGDPGPPQEQGLAEAIADRVRSVIPTQTDCTYFDGLVSSLGVLLALDAPGPEDAVARLAELAGPGGWPQSILQAPRYLPGAHVQDLTLGTAGVLLGALWARRHGVTGAAGLAGTAADVLMAEAEHEPTGTNWRMVPTRYCSEPPGPQMPNLSHGLAGIATALALAGARLDRPDLVAAAGSGAEHLVSLGDASGQGFVVPRQLPRGVDDQDDVTYTWCHGATGTSLLFLALDRAGVPQVAGRSPLAWHRACLHSVRTSGLPARLRPGFWDNDGRCCGTAGVGDVLLDSWRPRPRAPGSTAPSRRARPGVRALRAVRSGGVPTPHAALLQLVVEVIGEVHLNARHTPNHTHIVSAGQAMLAPGRAFGRPSALLGLSTRRYSQGYSQPTLSGLLDPHAGGNRRLRIPVHLRQHPPPGRRSRRWRASSVACVRSHLSWTSWPRRC